MGGWVEKVPFCGKCYCFILKVRSKLASGLTITFKMLKVRFPDTALLLNRDKAAYGERT